MTFRPIRAGTGVRTGFVLAMLGTAVLLCGFGDAAAGIKVSLVAPANVTVGSQFDVQLVVTESGSAFNAFEAIVGWDPGVLQRVPVSPISLQEGALMTGACPNRFHVFKPAADRDTITDALLCNQVSVTGPGTLYKLRFQAPSEPETTLVQLLPGLRFYDAGIAVNPVTPTHATIVIRSSVDVPAGVPAPALKLRVSPNPTRGATGVWIDAPQGTHQTVDVRDLAGRRVRRIDEGWHAAGTRRLDWDGRDRDGIPAPPGVYVLTLRAGDEIVSTRFTLLR
jgi:hypothetical protein